MYEENIAKPTASDKGTNNCFATPAMKKDGMNTASTQSIAVGAEPRRLIPYVPFHEAVRLDILDRQDIL